MQILMTLITVCVLGIAAPSQEAVAQAFEHYEAIRAALSRDTLTGVSKHATDLAALAEKAGGAGARRAAEDLGAATDIKAARDHFGKLSAALVPSFEKAGLAGVHFFTCPMVKQSWAQKGDRVENPYYGKSMSTCGVPKK